jgi:hypothetical protein
VGWGVCVAFTDSTVEADSGSAVGAAQSPEINQRNNKPATMEAEVTFFDINKGPEGRYNNQQTPLRSLSSSAGAISRKGNECCYV